ncbi:MAG: hypothetical protein ABL893_15615, partial [Hyphomicrobium sp.]
FMISEAYKAHFEIKSTEPPKIAAMTSLVLADFQPLRVKNRDDVVNPLSIYANELLSLSWASRPLGHDFDEIFSYKLKRDGLYRYLRLLSAQQLRSLGQYKADIALNPPIFREEYEIKLNHDTVVAKSELSDLPKIEKFILIFELMWDGAGRIID